MGNLTSANSVERAFAILELLNTASRGWNISEISRKLELPKSSTHMLISTLDRLGYIKKTAARGRFQLSVKMYGLGSRALHATPMSEIALQHMHWAVQQSRLTSHLGILENCQVIFIQKVDGPGLIKFDTYLGKCSELHCTGLGKALLAYVREDQVRRLLRKHEFCRFTKNTISTLEGFLTELTKVRRNGFAVDDEEEELGIRCVAVPVFLNGEPIAAISFTGTTSQLDLQSLEKIAQIAKRAAAHISAQL